MFCEKCGNPLPEDSKFCMNCGAKTDAVLNSTEQEAAASIDASAGIANEPVAAPIQAAPPHPQPQPAPIQAAPVQAAPVQTAQPQPQPAPVRPAPVQTPPPRPVQQAPVQPVQQAPVQSQSMQQPVQQPSQQPVQPAVVKKPEKVTPLPAWKFAGMFIILGIPILSLIMTLVWSFGGNCNRNTRSFARAVLFFKIIGFILALVSSIMYWSVLQEFFSMYEITF